MRARAHDWTEARNRSANCGKLKEKAERLDHRRVTNRRAADIAIALLAMDEAAVLRGRREMHEADRLLGRSAARTRNAGDRDRQMHRRACERAARHRLGGLA